MVSSGKAKGDGDANKLEATKQPEFDVRVSKLVKFHQ